YEVCKAGKSYPKGRPIKPLGFIEILPRQSQIFSVLLSISNAKFGIKSGFFAFSRENAVYPTFLPVFFRVFFLFLPTRSLT
ncbi:MAG: hypothetical protein KKG50_00130, partial [Candidatus Omnitrophica bacterium]|nr:hypothetical protein [Candidatus Omnitrophota bacterium]